NFDEKYSETECDSTASSSALSIVNSPDIEELSPTQRICSLVSKNTFLLHPHKNAKPLILPGQIQLTPLHKSMPSPIFIQSNQCESREILPKVDSKSNISQEYIQYERERRRNYARLLREKKRARVKELEDRAAFLEIENKRLRKNLEIYHARLAYAGIILTPSDSDIQFSNLNIYNSMNNFVPYVNTAPNLENQITPEEILNMPMGFNDFCSGNSIYSINAGNEGHLTTLKYT
ncbi:6480_t:CDS:2, partial [Scutellospora calospora]